MTLERQKISPHFDADIHAAIKAICESEGIEMNVWVETVIVDVVKSRIRKAMLVIETLEKSGASGSFRE